MARESWSRKVIRLLLPPKPLKIVISEADGNNIQDRVQKLRATLDGEEQWFLCLTKDKNMCLEENKE